MKLFEKRDLKSGIKEIEKNMINNIFHYLKNGAFLNDDPLCYMKAYAEAQRQADEGDSNCAYLFNYYNKTIKDYILESYNELIEEKNSNLIDKFLERINKINILIYWMQRIFSYLDRFYTRAKVKTTLSESAMDLYKSLFYEKIKQNIFIEINKLINEDRNGNKEHREKIKKVLSILKDFELKKPQIVMKNNKYFWVNKDDSLTVGNFREQDLFFEYFLEDTKKFVKAKANKDFLNMPFSEYAITEAKYLEEENERLKEYINPNYHAIINEINYQYLILDALKDFGPMDIYIKNLLENEESIKLINIHKLIRFIPKDLDPIAPVFISYIKNKYEEKFSNEELKKGQFTFIKEVIKFKKEFDLIIKDNFQNNLYFDDLKNKAFSSLITKESFAKKLSNYIDYCMRFEFKGKSPEEIENTLNDIIGFFHCLNSKILFYEESNKKMSERLLNGTSLSILYEKKFIAKLKFEAGLSYVSKMQGMIKDLERNKINEELYKSLEHKGCPNNIKMKVNVINQSAWDINKNLLENMIIPKFLSVCKEDFENFYLNKYKDHKLIWCLKLSKVEIEYLYLNQKYISISTLPQLLTLLLLEQKGELSLDIISQLLDCNINTLIKDIQGLIFNPIFNPHGQLDKGIILGSFKSKEFNNGDKIYINKDFICSKIRFNTIPLKLKKSESERKKEELEDLEIIQKYQSNILQSTITRIMKTRIGQKTTHIWLIEETAKQIDLFNAQPHQIKENIEKLIEKNVIKRADDISSNYEYIA